MKIKNIYIGSWFPKIRIHLDEFKAFLDSAAVHPALDSKMAAALKKKLNPEKVNLYLSKQDMAVVCAHSDKGYEYLYQEDGLLFLKREIKDFKKDKKQIVDFYQNTLSPCLAFLFSRGAGGLEIIRTPKLPKRLFLCTEKETKASILKFLKSENEKLDKNYDFGTFEIYYSDNLVILNALGKISEHIIDELSQELIFLSELNRHLYWLVQNHRLIWDDTEKILSSRFIKNVDIPLYIDKLTEYSKNVSNINARIDQIMVVLKTRNQTVENITRGKWQNYFANKLKKSNQEAAYIKNLFDMTSGFIKSNTSYLNSLYRQNQREAMNKLQMLFLVSVVVSFISLGTIMGAGFEVFQDGKLLLQGELSSYSVPVLIAFGLLTIILSGVIYFLWNYTYKNLSKKFKKQV
ncbi:MAG TPA: hypothetical protein VMX18_00225 [Candidatus Bipolaricaulota bacterium]|nr:hypothetical protein [Candidatus Bipolaricaulota bacterium]